MAQTAPFLQKTVIALLHHSCPPTWPPLDYDVIGYAYMQRVYSCMHSIHSNLAVVNFPYEPAEGDTEISVRKGDTIGIIEHLEGNMCKVSIIIAVIAIG